MPDSFAAPSDFFNIYDSTNLIITPNLRLSRYLHDEYAKWRSSDCQAWPTLNCLPLDLWLLSLWRSEKPAELQLNGNDCQLLWRTIIERDDNPLLNIHGTAQLAHEARDILINWQVYSPNHNGSALSGFEPQFVHWLEAFEEHCTSHQLVDLSAIRLRVVTSLRSGGSIELPSGVIFFSFDNHTPLQLTLIEAIKGKGVTVDSVRLKKKALLSRGSFSSEDSELFSAAKWAEELSAGKKNIAIVLPNLPQQRKRIERIFSEVFQTTDLRDNRHPEQPIFDISASLNLAETGVIHSALNILSLFSKPSINIDELSRFLLSPYTESGRSEALIQLDEFILEHCYSMSQAKLRSVIAERLGNTHTFYKQTAACIKLVDNAPRLQSRSDWMVVFKQILECCRWPGQGALDSVEIQATKTFEAIFESANRLDYLFPPCSLSKALSDLKHLVKTHEFQIKNDKPRIHILGIMEAAGLQFDALWVAQLHQLNWPQAARLNPFIPAAMQRSMNTPHSSAKRELDIAKSLTETLKHSADKVVFSHASQLSDGDSVLVSPLIKDIQEVSDANDYRDGTEFLWPNSGSALIELVNEENAPSVSRSDEYKGGTNIIKMQAECPFKAFASIRLNAKKPDIPNARLSPLDRGIIIHDSLERIWKKLKSQENLLELTDLALFQAVEAVVESEIEKYVHRLGPRGRTLEHKRCSKLILDWLAVEKKRAPFTVRETERKDQLTIGGLTLSVRFDRVDETGNGSTLVIDYKTGALSINAWMGDRPDDPQLPIYCITKAERIDGAAIAQIRAEQMQFKGIAAHDTIAPGIFAVSSLKKSELPENWDELIEHWTEVISSLAREFVSGDLRVMPKYGKQTCRLCALSGLCRIGELSMNAKSDKREKEV